MSEIYFNGRAWSKIVGEQEKKFLEALWNRAGGAQEPAQNLGEVVTTITSLEQSSSAAMYEVQALKRIVAAQATNEASLLSVIKKLEHRISQLEDAQ